MRQLLKSIIRYLPIKHRLYAVLKHLPLPSRIQRHLKFHDFFPVIISSNEQFYLYDNPLSSDHMLYWQGFWNQKDSESLLLWYHLASQSEHIMDVGAHVGVYSYLASTANPNAHVASFEPIPQTFETLSQTIRHNKFENITPYQAAVGESDGTIKIYYEDDATAKASTARADGAQYKEVQLVRIDTLMGQANWDSLDLVKIDVETAEPSVLIGAKHTISQSRPIFIVEVLNDDVAREIHNVLVDENYSFFLVDQDDACVVEVEEIKRKSKWSRDFVLCPKEKAYVIQNYVEKQRSRPASDRMTPMPYS